MEIGGRFYCCRLFYEQNLHQTWNRTHDQNWSEMYLLLYCIKVRSSWMHEEEQTINGAITAVKGMHGSLLETTGCTARQACAWNHSYITVCATKF